MTPPLYFLHIPKTGGKSLSRVLRRAYPMSRSLIETVLDNLPQHIVSLRSYDYIDGHLAWLPDHMLQPGTLRCTVLRDPVARTLSELFMIQRGLSYRYVAATPTDPVRDALRAGDFFRVLQSEHYRMQSTNVQCRFLARDVVSTSVRRNDQFIKGTPPVDESDFIAAKQHLKTIDFVGITEHLDDFAHMVGASIGLDVKKVPRDNSASHPSGAPTSISLFDASEQQEMLHIIEDMNRYDIELYRMAQERFAEQWRTHTPTPPVRQSVHARCHSATWTAYEILHDAYHRLFSYKTRSQLQLLNHVRRIFGIRSAPSP
jgi:hypothetical protein